MCMKFANELSCTELAKRLSKRRAKAIKDGSEFAHGGFDLSGGVEIHVGASGRIC